MDGEDRGVELVPDKVLADLHTWSTRQETDAVYKLCHQVGPRIFRGPNEEFEQ